MLTYGLLGFRKELGKTKNQELTKNCSFALNARLGIQNRNRALSARYIASSGRSYLALPIRSLMVGYATVKIVNAISTTTLGNISHLAP